MSKVLVTGAGGFIGGYIVEELLEKNHKVVGLDNLSKYGEVARSIDDSENYRFILGDCRNEDEVFEALEGCEHAVFGAAMIGGIAYFHKYAFDLLAVNEEIMAASTRAAIRRFQQKSLKKVTYLSSSMVYESTTHWPSQEGDELKIGPPLSSYGFQKLAVEYFAKSAFIQYGLPYTIVRPFNCVGIGEKSSQNPYKVTESNLKIALSHVVPDLIIKILRKQSPIEILGSGQQTRCYTYGGDLAEGIVNAVFNPNATNDDFNISTSEELSVIEVAQLIYRKINNTLEGLEYQCVEPFEYDVQKRVPDTTKAKKLLEFQARTTLDESLDKIIPWIKSNIKSN